MGRGPSFPCAGHWFAASARDIILGPRHLNKEAYYRFLCNALGEIIFHLARCELLEKMVPSNSKKALNTK
jgi:hypothetical protein